jgi:hypothetical protein
MTFIPHDTGEALSQREQIQDAIIRKLTVLKDAGLIKCILPIAWRIHNEDSWNQTHEEINSRYPAITVCPLDLDDAKEGGTGRAAGLMDVQIVCVSRHARNTVEGRIRSDAAGLAGGDPGVWSILQLIKVRLFDADLEVEGVHELVPHSEGEVASSSDYSAWGQIWHVQVETNVDWARGILTKLELVATRLRAGENPATDLSILTEIPQP